MNFMNKTFTVDIDENYDIDEVVTKIVNTINSVESGINITIQDKKEISKHSHKHNESFFEENKKELIQLGVGSLVYVFGIFESFINTSDIISNIIFLIAYIAVGGEVLLRAAKNITKGQVFDENFLMSIATLGAIAIGEFPEAVGVMLFYQIGEFFQHMAVDKSRKSISSLMEIRPDYANLKVNGDIKVVSPHDVKIGDYIVVKPGEKVPLDGKVVDGNSMLDTSALTGESVLRDVLVGDEVLSGFINKSSLITIEVTKEFNDSTVAKILDLVENASSKKSKTENFITRFAKYYTPAVVICALAIAFIPPIFTETKDLGDWFYRGLIFLVVSCPCALVLSIPLSFFSGIGNASKNGILIKGGNYLEALKNVETIVFDKTGTLTKGVFNVTKIVPSGASEDELLEYAAIAECSSNHPIATSIIKYYNKEINKENISSYEEVPGKGIKVKYEEDYILAGNYKLMQSENVLLLPVDESGSVVYIAINGRYTGYIVISDEIKVDSKDAIINLKKSGIKQTVMLTGDNKLVAEKVGNELNIDIVYSNLLPHEKVEKLEEVYSNKSEKGTIAFVGDGINDAPVLARADVGIAMGGLGSDAAIEAADIVLMTDEISKLNKAIEIAKKTNVVVWQNIIFALGIKLIVLVLGAGGIATMWEAIFADVGVAVIAILNAMRVMK